MKYAQILDCTLRDGGYLVDKEFGDENIHGIVKGLVDTKIDIIEIGFLQNEGFGEGKPIFKNSLEAEKYIPQKKGNSIFAAFADFSRYDITNLDEHTGKSFDAVRICFFKHERFDVINMLKEVKRKGYLLFVQPVDVMGYTDAEFLDLITSINDLEPYCFSIVDTFGSMYEDDLYRVFSLIDNNLNPETKVGFHSHNNLQMSSALTQAFLKNAHGKRNVIVDTTISGMGRGAGNTPTELIVQYMIDKMGYTYDVDSLLDVIDYYMRNISSRATWGYSTNFYIAGAYSAHVNNIAYLSKKNSIKSKDIRYILNEIGIDKRKKYHYDELENIYLQYMQSDIDDAKDFYALRDIFKGKNVVILAAGKSIVEQREEIIDYIQEKDSIVISINNIHEGYDINYLYVNNIKRYNNFKESYSNKIPMICTSNIKQEKADNEYIISFLKLIKCGWENMDNSTILLLRLLDSCKVSEIGIAGFDGYGYGKNYAEENNEVGLSYDEAIFINGELQEMLDDFMDNKRKTTQVKLITKSRLSIER